MVVCQYHDVTNEFVVETELVSSNVGDRKTSRDCLVRCLLKVYRRKNVNSGKSLDHAKLIHAMIFCATEHQTRCDMSSHFLGATARRGRDTDTSSLMQMHTYHIMSLFGFDATSFDSSLHDHNVIADAEDDDDERFILASVASAEHAAAAAECSWINPSRGVSITGASEVQHDFPTAVWVQVGNSALARHDIDIDDESYGGVTILSSVPSSQVSVLASSPHQNVTDARSDDDDDETYSIRSTQTWTNIANSNIILTPGQQSILSLNPQSLASSMSDVSLPWSSGSSQRSVVTPEGGATTVSAISQALVCRSNAPTRHPAAAAAWFERLQTEQDWDGFRHQALELLAAAAERNNATESFDVMLSRIIEQEETMFWSHNNQALASRGSGVCRLMQRLQQTGWLLLGETLLVAATVAAFGTADHGSMAHRVS
ncbi:hypothetical protein MPSEU_000282600 [Mayamaea pseudoterrestris]|nr:hypothetical protein MPSEU_000282600 [Mayamaea pseudoterrestris]